MDPHPDVFTLNTNSARVSVRARVTRLLSTLTSLSSDDTSSIHSQSHEEVDDDTDDSPLPSIESVMCIPVNARKEHFFASIQIGDQLFARVTSSTDQGHVLTAICFVKKRRFIDDLGIRLLCAKAAASLGDVLKVIVVHVIRDQHKLIVADKGVMTSDDEYPIHFRVHKSGHNSDFHTSLVSSMSFANPTCVQQLCEHMKLPPRASLLIPNSYPDAEMARTLRRTQSSRWAHNHVVNGIEQLKMGNYVEAQQCLNSALTIDQNNVEALVARGALFFNNESLTRALEDFERAIQLEPNHANARKYMSETLVSIGRKHQERGDLESASKSYRRAIAMNLSNSEAKNALNNVESSVGSGSRERGKDIGADVNKKDKRCNDDMDVEKESAPLSETKNKLKLLLEEEKSGKSKHKKSNRSSKKKRRSNRTSSSESESSDSDSDDTSSTMTLSSSEDSSDESSSSSERTSKKRKKRRKDKDKKKKKRRSKKSHSKTSKDKSLKDKSSKDEMKTKDIKPNIEWIESNVKEISEKTSVSVAPPVSFSIKKKETSTMVSSLPLSHFIPIGETTGYSIKKYESDPKRGRKSSPKKSETIPGLTASSSSYSSSPPHKYRGYSYHSSSQSYQRSSQSYQRPFQSYQRSRSRSRSRSPRRYYNNRDKMDRVKVLRDRIEKQLARDAEMERKIEEMGKPI